MARLSGVDIPDKKRVEVALTYIFGIGRVTARKILAQAKVDPNIRVKNLGDDQMAQIRHIIEGNLQVEGDARRNVSTNIKIKMDIGCYQGLRHRKGLPVRGQRTKTNSRTRKGPAKTIAGKKKAPTSK
jgi:small subunit ribosomal protein S13